MDSEAEVLVAVEARAASAAATLEAGLAEVAVVVTSAVEAEATAVAEVTADIGKPTARLYISSHKTPPTAEKVLWL